MNLIPKPQLGAAWNRAHPLTASLGTGGCWALLEGGGPRVRDWGPNGLNVYNGGAVWNNLVGNVAWDPGTLPPYFGHALGSFASNAYAQLDPPTPIAASPPFWFAVLCANSNTTNGQTVLSQGYSGSSTQASANITINGNSTAQRVQYAVTDNTGTASTVFATSQPCNDGYPHLYQGSTFAANSHSLAVDGVTVATGSVSIGSLSNSNLLTVGAQRRSTVTGPFKGVVYAALVGNGPPPDPMTLYLDVFAALRPAEIPLAMLGAYPPPPTVSSAVNILFSGVVLSAG